MSQVSFGNPELVEKDPLAPGASQEGVLEPWSRAEPAGSSLRGWNTPSGAEALRRGQLWGPCVLNARLRILDFLPVSRKGF